MSYIEQFCSVDHFWTDLSNQFSGSVMTDFKCRVSYYFDYLNKELLFFNKNKNSRVASNEVYVLTIKLTFQFKYYLTFQLTLGQFVDAELVLGL